MTQPAPAALAANLPLAGLTSGVAFVLAALVTVALTLGAPQARADSAAGCAMSVAQAHGGYGETPGAGGEGCR
ncbi:MAG: hypothetical protein IPL88_10050 [Rhizobiales bacterium]|nr:hypothetical protein [Hyphomicrobiales bacterium]